MPCARAKGKEKSNRGVHSMHTRFLNTRFLNTLNNTAFPSNLS